MKKITNYLAIMTFISLSQQNSIKFDAAASNYVDCGGFAFPKGIVFVSSTIMLLFQIVIPVIIIIMGCLDVLKATSAKDASGIKKAQSMLVKRIISATVAFLVVSIVQVTITLTSDTTDLASCLQCITQGPRKCQGEIESPNNPNFPPEAEYTYNSSEYFIQPRLREGAYTSDGSNSPSGSPSGSGVSSGIDGISGDAWDVAFYITGKSESNGDPGTIGNISWDRGGKSYGVYQFASNMGTVDNYISWLGNQSDDYSKSIYPRLKKIKVGSASFDSEWKKIASENSKSFAKNQQMFMVDNFYWPAITTIKKYAPNFDPKNYTVALSSMIISTSTQFGPAGSPFKKIFSGAYNLNDEKNLLLGFKVERIKAFSRTSSRYEMEYKESLELYEKYKGTKFDASFTQ